MMNNPGHQDIHNRHRQLPQLHQLATMMMAMMLVMRLSGPMTMIMMIGETKSFVKQCFDNNLLICLIFVLRRERRGKQLKSISVKI